MEGELLRWLPWVRGGLWEACPKFAVSGRPTCADPGLPTSLSPHPQQAVGGPGAFCWVLCFVAFFFFSLFIVADALHQETELGAPRREMVPIYIGFQEIDPFFFSVRSRAARHRRCQRRTATFPSQGLLSALRFEAGEGHDAGSPDGAGIPQASITAVTALRPTCATSKGDKAAQLTARCGVGMWGQPLGALRAGSEHAGSTGHPRALDYPG